METETKLVKTQEIDDDIENNEVIEKELNQAIKNHESVKKLIDIFFLGLFLIFIMYSVI